MKKKRYVTPLSTIIELGTSSMLANSPTLGVTEDEVDAAEQKVMKGFTFLPRQSGTNGWVKDYEIYVSQDGKNWGEPIHKGTFAANAELKRVMFSKPVKARDIRFRALNEQGGQDFASGAEFSLIAE